MDGVLTSSTVCAVTLNVYRSPSVSPGTTAYPRRSIFGG